MGTNLIMDLAPHVGTGSAPVMLNLGKTDPQYDGCVVCGGDPIYIVTWSTPGAWWGDSHWERYCHACVHGRGIAEGWVYPTPEATRIEYAILVSDGGAWMETGPREIERLATGGFVPVIKIFPALT